MMEIMKPALNPEMERTYPKVFNIEDVSSERSRE